MPPSCALRVKRAIANYMIWQWFPVWWCDGSLIGAKSHRAMEHTVKGNHKLLKECNLPLTAPAAVDLIVTEMGVIEVTPEGFKLIEINPEYTVEDVQAATEATLIIADDLKDMQ